MVATQKDDPAQVLGYICYGPTPMTQNTWDLYWVVTDPDHKRRGIGSALLRQMEEEIRASGGALIRVETSTLDGYGDAHRFYALHGYPELSRLVDFYKPGDDLITLVKYLS